MPDYADYNDPGATATAIGATDLTGTGLAKESGGNLDTHTKLLGGTQAGALVANIGATIGQEVAAQIATGSPTGTPGGTPLLHGAKQVYSSGNQVIAALGTFSTPNITVTKPGYLIRVSAQMSAAGSVTPFLKAALTWSVSPAAGTISAAETWYAPCGAAAAIRTNGKGPTKGDTLAITFTNGDAANTVTINVNVWETTQHITRDDWRSAVGAPSAAGAGIAGDALANILANDSITVNGNTSQTRGLPLYAGQVNVLINQNNQAGSTVRITPSGDFTLTGGADMVNLDWTASPRLYTGVMLPRGPCSVIALNNGAAAVTLTISMVALEYAS